MTELIGKTLGRYQIQSLLGEGGMATVYKALDTHLEREVAVKIIRSAAFSPEVLALDHPRSDHNSCNSSSRN